MEIKISTYDFFNKFILGLVFIGSLILLFSDKINLSIEDYQNIKENKIILTVFCVAVLAIVYEMGIIINRMGSLLEDFLIICHLIRFDKDYKKLNDKRKDYPILTILSREYALSRNSIVLFLLISIITFVNYGWYGFIPFVIMLVFYYSCRKYAKKIVDLMK